MSHITPIPLFHSLFHMLSTCKAHSQGPGLDAYMANMAGFMW